MEIIALQEYTDKYISLYEGEIRNISDGILANKLISEGIIAEHGESSPDSGGSSSNSSGFFIIRTTDYDSDEGTWSKVDKTFSEIQEAIVNNQIPVLYVIDGKYLNSIYYFEKTNAASPSSSVGSISFICPVMSSGVVKLLRISIDSGNNITKSIVAG